MTTGEILVIVAAAAVFVIINLIMWSIIIKKERRETPSATVTAVDSGIRLPGGVPDAAADMGFRLLENTVIVHTDDRI
ncbi:MAG: hypothetical protein J5724_00915 [Ruminococcus sp.]|nr:hypothetical protein [Ruminococcus sp.]